MLNQRMYQKHIRTLELEEFPELESNEGFSDEIVHSNWIVYPPYRHFSLKKPLLTEKIVKDLITNNKKLLSVGCGPSYLERLLVRLGIKQENIVLADKTNENIPVGFKFYRFNAYEKWPTFTNFFDYIIFPESVHFQRGKTAEQNQNNLYNLFVSSIKVLNSQGEVRMTGGFPPESKISQIRKNILKLHPKIKLVRHNSSFLTITKRD